MLPIPRSPIEKIIAPVHRFIHMEYTGGIVLCCSVLVAILWANSSFADSYHHLWEINFSIGTAGAMLSQPLHSWINDGLMALFFFVIGLELKREFMDGELASIEKASLPMMAALGGMLVPALIYWLMNRGTAASHGWGIPMATDIAFALALLSMAGKHIPASLKIFLSALAVADDLGAVLVIAFFYTESLNFLPLAFAAGLLLILFAGNRLGIRSVAFYLIIGLGVWTGFLLSGVHATIAGVWVAFTIPAARKIDEKLFSANLRKLSDDFEKDIPESGPFTTGRQHDTIEQVKTLALAAETPLQKIEYVLHPWVAFVIMPLFALANAGMIIGADFFTAIQNPVSLGVILGLIAGKFIGIMLFTWLMVAGGLSRLPENAAWKHMTGLALLAGVGFTMSLFISNLAFQEALFIDQAKYGILLASVIAGTLGLTVLKMAGRKNSA